MNSWVSGVRVLRADPASAAAQQYGGEDDDESPE
jgi:hypothetical protein